MSTKSENQNFGAQAQSEKQNSSLNKEKRVTIQNAAILFAAILSLAALYVLSQYNYLLFHSVVEVFSIVIAFAIFAIAWNSRRLMDNNYLAFIGIAFLFVAGFDLLHMLAFKGMGVFPNVGANLATQLWIATRYVLSLSLLTPILFMHRKVRSITVVVAYSLMSVLVLGSIFYWGNFPQAYVDGVGLTNFKVGSEYAISLIILVAIGLLVRNKKEFSNNVYKMLIAGMAAAVATELAFTLYVDVYGVANMVGHLLNVVSFYLIYRALVETSLTKPYELLFRNLKQSETNLANHATELTTVNTRLEQEIAERTKAEEELERYQNHLEKLVEEKTKQLKDSERLATIGATAGMVGHDIRNPLQTVTGELYLAKEELNNLPDGDSKENLRESLNIINEQTIYVNKIVSDLQDFAKPIAPKIEEINLEKTIQTVLSSINLRQSDKPEGIQIEYHIGESFPNLKVDESYLRRILQNLVTNAIQAMPNGGKLNINAAITDGQARITVEDTGNGIPEEFRNKLFTPLMTTKSKGQGFGLAVVKRFTEGLGGTVSFESEVGKGTKFIISLPTSK